MHGLLFLAAMQVPLPMPAQPGFGPVFDPFPRRLAYDDERKVTAGDLAMARTLIMSPVGQTDAMPTADEWPRLSASLHQAAVAMEILDLAERLYIGADAKDLQIDLNVLRDRWADIGQAPRSGESNRFPFSRIVCSSAIEFNRAFRDRIEKRMEFESDRRHELQDAIALVEKHYTVWDALRDSKCEYYHVTVRRQALKKLKVLIGPDDFAMGAMPLPVPAELFREMP